jgi:hypothetical protein
MNKKILFIIALTWILVGCVSNPPSNGAMFGETGTLSVSGCTSYAGPMACSGDKNDPKVTINLDTWTVTPECVNAKKGKIITVTLESASPIDKGSVVLFPKDPTNYFWMARTNDPNKNKIKLTAPKQKKSGENFPVGEYKYGIWTAANCLDPRVKVDN